MQAGAPGKGNAAAGGASGAVTTLEQPRRQAGTCRTGGSAAATAPAAAGPAALRTRAAHRCASPVLALHVLTRRAPPLVKLGCALGCARACSDSSCQDKQACRRMAGHAGRTMAVMRRAQHLGSTGQERHSHVCARPRVGFRVWAGFAMSRAWTCVINPGAAQASGRASCRRSTRSGTHVPQPPHAATGEHVPEGTCLSMRLSCAAAGAGARPLAWGGLQKARVPYPMGWAWPAGPG